MVSDVFPLDSLNLAGVRAASVNPGIIRYRYDIVVSSLL